MLGILQSTDLNCKSLRVFLKNLLESFPESLQLIFSKLWSIGKVPDDGKKSNVMPIKG